MTSPLMRAALRRAATVIGAMSNPRGFAEQVDLRQKRVINLKPLGGRRPLEEFASGTGHPSVRLFLNRLGKIFDPAAGCLRKCVWVQCQDQLADAWRLAVGREKRRRLVAELAPIRPAASNSTISASAVPLASPIGIIVPASAAVGSVVGRPSPSSAQPSGIFLPLCSRP